MKGRKLDDKELENVSGGAEGSDFSPLPPDAPAGLTSRPKPDDPEVKQQEDPTEHQDDVSSV